MEGSPLGSDVLLWLGPVPLARAVVTTWLVMAVLVGISWLVMRRAQIQGGPAQAVAEIVVTTMEAQFREVLQRDPWPYLPLLGTLFLFILFANLSAVVPGLRPPTAHIETPAALALIVFLASHYFGIRSLGLSRYLRRYLRPNPLLLPLNLLSELTRTFSLMVRLFGNMLSHEMVIAILVLLAGLLVPVPFMLLGVLIGIIQAYIFTMLAAVFIAAAIGSMEAA